MDVDERTPLAGIMMLVWRIFNSENGMFFADIIGNNYMYF